MAFLSAGAVAALSLFVAVWLWVSRRNVLRTADALRAELDALKNAPVRVEYRIERFDVLWYPSVEVLPSRRDAPKVAPGLPHCRNCAQALSAGTGGEWSCVLCGAKHPASLVDTMVIDTITDLALKYYKERVHR